MTQNRYSDLCAAIGNASLQWAAAEQTLDICVTIVFKYCGGNSMRKDLPRSLSTKTEFMRDAFKKLASLAPYATKGRAIMNDFDDIAKGRNDMIHSALMSDGPRTGLWYFLKFDYGTDIHTARSISFSLRDFQTLGNNTMVLASDIQRLSKQLTKKFAPWK